MKYKFSKYNTYIDIGEYEYIFNSYSYKIIKISKKLDIFDVIIKHKDESFNIENSKKYKKLIDDGFLVKESEDEELKRKLHINDLVMDNKLVFTMLTTGQCNFRCKYCYEKFEQGKMSDELVNSFIKYIESNIHKYSGVHLRWFGGEPILAMDVVEKICKNVRKICKNQNREFSSEMLTNAYLLNITTFKKLVNLRS